MIAVLRSIDTSSHLGLLLGAGASAAAGLPDWDSFAVDLLVRSGAIADLETARTFLSGQDPAIAAEAAKGAAAERWPEMLERSLYGEQPVDPSALHTAVALLATRRGCRGISLMTLNYDNLLEEAIQRLLDEDDGRNEQVFPRESVRPRAPEGDFEVHHLHGYLPPGRGSADSVVLTLSDYNKLGQKQAWQAATLSDALQKGPLILAGTSYRDPDVRQWIHNLLDEDPEAEVLVFLAREGLGLDREQFEHVAPALKEQWSALGVRVIATHDYGDAAQALRELPHLADDGYRAPLDRAALLWQVHEADFTTLQEHDAQELEEDLAVLREALPTFENVTLWLCDGERQIVRWAANDRTYRSSRMLRRVFPGHDSPWISGQCLGRNDLLIREVADPGRTARWHSVAAAPIVAQIPGGPALPCAVVSAASARALEESQLDEISVAFAELSEKWATVLEQRVASGPQP